MNREQIEQVWWEELAYPRDEPPPYLFATQIAKLATHSLEAHYASMSKVAREGLERAEQTEQDSKRFEWLTNHLQDFLWPPENDVLDPTEHYTNKPGSDPSNSWPNVWRRAIDAEMRKSK